jgi:hypothetical protein
MPAWSPGKSTWTGGTVTVALATQWWNWYIGAVINAHQWQIAAYRTAGWDGLFSLTMPGQGGGPLLVTTRLNALLGDVAADSYATLQTGSIWQLQVPALANPAITVLDCSSVFDGSGTPANNVSGPGDVLTSLANADPAVSNWSATRWLAYLAAKSGIPICGESSAGNPLATEVAGTMAQAFGCGLYAIYWANDDTMASGGSNATPTQVVQGFNAAYGTRPGGLTITVSGTPTPNEILTATSGTAATFKTPLSTIATSVTATGPTQLLNLASGLTQEVTLGANCAFSFENWPSGVSTATVVVTENGTGGYAPSFPGVNWIGPQPGQVLTPTTGVTIYTLMSPNGGTTVYGYGTPNSGSGPTGWNSSNPDYTATGAEPTQPFPGSPWAAKIPTSPTLASNSATLVANLVNGMAAYGGTMSLSTGASRYVVHGLQLTDTDINVGSGYGNPEVPLPPAWVAAPGSDSEMVVWDVDDETWGSYSGPVMFNFWQANASAKTASTVQIVATNGSFTAGFTVSSTGALASYSTSSTASGAPYGAGIITVADWLYGTINHPLALTVGFGTGTSVLPAVHGDGSTSIASGGIPEGTLYFFESSVAAPSGMGTFEAMVFQALKTYGAYAIDSDSGYFSIAMENYAPWQTFQGWSTAAPPNWPVNMAEAYAAFPHIPWSSLSVLVVP